jgi:beta-lactamase superfamily II metal-dependent hydrolase
MSIFRIDMLPAREGDCLWIEYGPADNPRRILIDGGRKIAWQTLKSRFETLPEDQRQFELLILTHIDADHIEGLLAMLQQEVLPISFKDVWFNGYDHLLPPTVENLGAKQGEEFSKGIARHGWPWNAAFGGKSVVIPNTGVLPVKTLEGGMVLTLLSPDWPKLAKLEPVWRKEMEEAGLIAGAERQEVDGPKVESLGPPTVDEIAQAARSNFEADTSAANGSSICVLAAFEGRSAILTGDAHADRVARSLASLDGSPVSVDAFKLSHHGSRGTHSADLMKQFSAKRFLVSTDGSRHEHPHLEAIARTLMNAAAPVDLIFNYDSAQSKKWDANKLKTQFGYRALYPENQVEGMVRVEL